MISLDFYSHDKKNVLSSDNHRVPSLHFTVTEEQSTCHHAYGIMLLKPCLVHGKMSLKRCLVHGKMSLSQYALHGLNDILPCAGKRANDTVMRTTMCLYVETSLCFSHLKISWTEASHRNTETSHASSPCSANRKL